MHTETQRQTTVSCEDAIKAGPRATKQWQQRDRLFAPGVVFQEGTNRDIQDITFLSIV